MKRFAIAVLALLVAPAFALANPSGLWGYTNDNGETHIRVEPGGGNYTGTIEWMENPRNDTENPDPNLQDRPLVGVQIFTGDEELSPTKWGGSLYNPEDGRTYSGTLEMLNENTLELEGCAFIIFCRTATWTRIPEMVNN